MVDDDGIGCPYFESLGRNSPDRLPRDCLASKGALWPFFQSDAIYYQILLSLFFKNLILRNFITLQSIGLGPREGSHLL